VAVGCLLVGFLLVVAYIHTHRGAPQTAKVHADLVQRVRAAQKDANTLDSRARQIAGQLDTLRNRALGGGGSAARRLAGELQAAGAVAVEGPGITVTLREPKHPTPAPTGGRGGTTPIETAHILTDRDVRSVVDELWRDGAEAIGVNGVRLTPTSAIRFAGQAVLVDFQPITSPYRVTAIGDEDALSTGFAQSEVAIRYQSLAGAEGIGFSFAEHSKLTLPASPPANLRYATPAGRSR
jgi:uncharacterized protein YlxW (UPF0749 family)